MFKYFVVLKAFSIDETSIGLDIYANEDETAKFLAQKLGATLFGENGFSYTVSRIH